MKLDFDKLRQKSSVILCCRVFVSLFFMATLTYYIVMEFFSNNSLYISTKEGNSVCLLNVKFPITDTEAANSNPNCQIFRHSARIGIGLFSVGYILHVTMWVIGYHKWFKVIANSTLIVAMASAAFAGYRLSDGLTLTCVGLSSLTFICDSVSFADYSGYIPYADLVGYFYTYRGLTIVECVNMGALVVLSLLDTKGSAKPLMHKGKRNIFGRKSNAIDNMKAQV